MQQLVKPVGQGVVQNPPDPGVDFILRVHPVAVEQQQPLALKFALKRAVVRYDAELIAEKGPEVEVVVAADVMNFGSGASQLMQYAKNLELRLGDVMGIFHPELENVAQQEKMTGPAGQRAEKGFERFLAFRLRVLVKRSQMQIRDEESAFIHI